MLSQNDAMIDARNVTQPLTAAPKRKQENNVDEKGAKSNHVKNGRQDVFLSPLNGLHISREDVLETKTTTLVSYNSNKTSKSRQEKITHLIPMSIKRGKNLPLHMPKTMIENNHIRDNLHVLRPQEFERPA